MVRREVRLAPAELSAEKARQIAWEKLRPINQGLIASGAAVTFETFTRRTYQATVMPLMASSTQSRYQGIIDKYLIPAFGRLALRELTPRNLQAYLSSLSGTGLSHESMDKIRDVLASILGAAVRYEYLVRNPAQGLRFRRPGRAGGPSRSSPRSSLRRWWG